MLTVPPAFVDATVRREGDTGRRWIRDLPALVARCAAQWGCNVTGEAAHGQVALVVPVDCPGGPAVLKVSFPHPGNRGEAAALRRFDGRGAVRLLDADEEHLALLLERAGPRTLACEPVAEDFVEIAGALARRLAVTAEPGTPSLADTTDEWAEQLDEQVASRRGLLPDSGVRRARATIAELARDRTATLLHGDLHAGNVLASERERWLAIDPKGWRGTAAYDAFTVVMGRRGDLAASSDLPRVIRARVRRFADAAGVGNDLAAACCQARATSSLLHQDMADGNWFDRELLTAVATLN